MMIRVLLLLSSLIAMWVYIGWRILYTLPNGYAIIFAMLLLLVEVIEAIQSTIFYLIIFDPTDRQPPSLPDQLWTVDVLIATYNEPVEILKKTAAACKNLDYPSEFLHIWICDDGRREEVRLLAEELEIGYLTRPSNEHAKAGNLNHALTHIKGELLVTLDADMIPKPEFLKRTAGFFKFHRVAFVQTPQSFYNEDIFQFNLFQNRSIPNEQDLFMRVIQAGRDRFNAVIYAGSNAVFRRSAIDSIGGFATGTITEDFATGMLLQAKGYRTVFLNEVLAEGLATESLPDLLKQRIRWGRGTIQTVRKWNPLCIEGLSLMQRILYMTSFVYWYSGIGKMIFISAPLLFLIFGIPVLNTTLSGLLGFWLPHFILSGIVFRVCTNKVRDRFWSHVYDTAMAPAISWAILVETFTRKPIPFRVTPKGVTAGQTKFHKELVIPHLVFLAISVLGIIIGLFILLQGTDQQVKESVLINLFWSVYNLIGLVVSIMLGWERPRMRNTERFERSYKIVVETEGVEISGTTINISEDGCRILLNHPIPLSKSLKLIMYGQETHEFQGTIVHFDLHPEGFQAGIQFEPLNLRDYQRWIRELYGTQPEKTSFQLQRGSNSISVFLEYFKHFQFLYRPKNRKSQRIKTNIDCQVQLLPAVTLLAVEEAAAANFDSFNRDLRMTAMRPGEIHDVSLQGCQLRVGNVRTCKPGDGVAVALPHIYQILIGRVVYAQPSGKEFLIGVNWIDEITGRRVMEVLMSNNLRR
ncbi:glycosyltransferase family 2 protein [Effusibacillus dendaii]|uniref:cellulose synthase (UDP-forming) n=1 Tax=Effusibacillus dendaii TaxID=2743772 RepID=A0A7I8DDP4_9BACL|nr:glycosyltransferase family 2 protein [Effusibacillus dendaii]BCJ86011.1 glycosyl transferase [Effusibacillus dendaii]